MQIKSKLLKMNGVQASELLFYEKTVKNTKTFQLLRSKIDFTNQSEFGTFTKRFWKSFIISIWLEAIIGVHILGIILLKGMKEPFYRLLLINS